MHLGAPHPPGTSAGYRVEVSSGGVDPAWDAFLADIPSGHHIQTSLWGQLKASQGWTPVRVQIRRDDELVAGVQVLERPLPVVGAVAYAPRGPVFGSTAPEPRRLMIECLNELARDRGIRHLTVQPADNGQPFIERLRDAGYRPSAAAVAPVATVQVDVTGEPDEILARMRKNHRRYVRHGLRQGMVGRVGDADDLTAFYQLVLETSRRQRFQPFPFVHFTTLWEIFRPSGQVQLFLTEYDGQPVSGQLAIAFGDRVTAKTSGWTGRHGSLGPNHVMEWTTIQWARANGYRYYDLEGIDVRAASRRLNDEPLTDELRKSHSFYKLGFGGEVVMFPEAHVLVPNRALHAIYWTMFPGLSRLRTVRSAIHRLRTR
jgi:lipid II:glycine glycyltransferase (peptidoglycan interpeptide bridge formation enzyme)